MRVAAVFNKQNRFYCSTTDGEVSFHLYSTIRERLNDDPNLTTLSYSNSAITQVQSIMLIFSNKEDAGVSLMIPPHFIYDIVETNLNKRQRDIGCLIQYQCVLQWSQVCESSWVYPFTGNDF